MRLLMKSHFNKFCDSRLDKHKYGNKKAKIKYIIDFLINITFLFDFNRSIPNVHIVHVVSKKRIYCGKKAQITRVCICAHIMHVQ